MNEENNIKTTSSHVKPESKDAVSAPLTASKRAAKTATGAHPHCSALFGGIFWRLFSHHFWL